MGIKIIDIAVNEDNVHIFFQYFPKYSVSFITGSVEQGWEVVEKYISSQNCTAGEKAL